MICRLNQCLLVAVVFILGVGYATAQNLLIEAAEKGDTEKVKALLAQGADVNAKNKRGSTALMLARDRGHSDTVRALVAKGGDVDAKDNNGLCEC
jgi:ankyrin repeat protein